MFWDKCNAYRVSGEVIAHLLEGRLGVWDQIVLLSTHAKQWLYTHVKGKHDYLSYTRPVVPNPGPLHILYVTQIKHTRFNNSAH